MLFRSQLREKHGQFATLSLPKLLDHYGEEKLDEIIKGFTKRTVDYMMFDYFGKTFYVSHAGFEPIIAQREGAWAGIEPRGALIYDKTISPSVRASIRLCPLPNTAGITNPRTPAVKKAIRIRPVSFRHFGFLYKSCAFNIAQL